MRQYRRLPTQHVLEKIKEYWAEYGTGPSVSWLAHETERSVSVIAYKIDVLEKDGKIEWPRRNGRRLFNSMRVVEGEEDAE